jgi:hypothetical protein
VIQVVSFCKKHGVCISVYYQYMILPSAMNYEKVETITRITPSSKEKNNKITKRAQNHKQ